MIRFGEQSELLLTYPLAVAVMMADPRSRFVPAQVDDPKHSTVKSDG